MGLFRTSLISATLLLVLAHAQDDDGFDLPELPPPAAEQPATVQPSSETAPSSEAFEAVPAQEDNYAGPQNDAMDAPEPEPSVSEQTETAEPAQVPTTAAEPVSEGEPDKFGDTPPKIKVRKFPDNLDRPVRVGVFVDEKKLFVRQGNQTISITAVGNQLEIESNGTSETVSQREFYTDENKKCLNIAPTEKQLKSSCYPGYFIVKATKSKITAINVVDVEDYIRGVVPYEIGKLDSSRFEALKAQAVAARTYVYKHFNSRDAMGFDVYADTKDQVYMGYKSATPLTNAAVKATAGETMTYRGEFIIAYYHSTCGGKTETMVTWDKKNLPYLKSVPDLRPNGQPWCNESSYGKWMRKFTDKELVTLFQQNSKEAKAKVPKFKKLKDISIKKKLPSGRIYTLLVSTDKGTFKVTGDKVRWLFKQKGTILPSSLFTISHKGHNWILEGKGYGHGVGMCQMGVRARAQAGQNYLDILNHYYPGITLERFEH
jgi:stage II sporulation protein D